MSGYRNITVNDRVFRWRVGTSHVSIRADDGKGQNPTLLEVVGPEWTWNDIERARHKGTSFAIMPSVIANYIRRTFFNEDLPLPRWSDSLSSWKEGHHPTLNEWMGETSNAG